MRILRRRGNIWIAGAVGMIVGPWILNKGREVTGIGVSLPTVGG